MKKSYLFHCQPGEGEREERERGEKNRKRGIKGIPK